ncbi:11054_t:CDS:2 [Funneliformis caledonium]|uniref:11054_t:CDS:1 n=1 Tax=Funneliformis caledonium TaxID=1117310 RepID=A0A9N8VYM9_9GLOM|nr:11054_t:CDS:2 [Funneliformis caledonium]
MSNNNEVPTEVFKFFLRLAESGNAVAQYVIAICYQQGKGIDINYNKAFKWFYNSARGGFINAQYSLAQCYIFGKGTHKDEHKAFLWYKVSAEGGSPTSNGPPMLF